VKLGDLEQNNPFFFFGGYELEMPFHYKQKRFEDGDKVNKITGYFSKRTERFTQSVYAGVQFRNGFSLKFKYYLDGFFNQDFEEFRDQPDGSRIAVKPYKGFDANVFYFSISWYPFQDSKLLVNTKDSEQEDTVTTLKYN
jgi:hypothetical protein